MIKIILLCLVFLINFQPSLTQNLVGLPIGATCNSGTECASNICLNDKCESRETLTRTLAPWMIGVAVIGN